MIIFPANHEGRGIGFTEKIKAYNLIQTKNMDTYEANTSLDHNEDLRNYDYAKNILNYFGLTVFKLLTNNPNKLKCMAESFKVTQQDCQCEPCETNIDYLTAKAKKTWNI